MAQLLSEGRDSFPKRGAAMDYKLGSWPCRQECCSVLLLFPVLNHTQIQSVFFTGNEARLASTLLHLPVALHVDACLTSFICFH